MSKHTKPAIVYIDNVGGANDFIESGFENRDLAAYLRQEQDIDILLFKYIEHLSEIEVIKQLCQAGIITAFVVRPDKYTIEGDKIDKLYLSLRENGINVPFLIMHAWSLSEPIVLHPEDALHINDIDNVDVVIWIENERTKFKADTIQMNRTEQFLLYKKLESVSSVLPSSEIVEYFNLGHTATYIADFDREAEIILSMSKSERKQFDEVLDQAQGYKKDPRGGYLKQGIGMGDHCASFATNTWSKDIFLTQTGRCHDLAKMEMRFFLEEIVRLRRERNLVPISIEMIGGFIYRNVEGFKSPIMVMTYRPGDFDCEDRKAFARFAFESRLALPVDVKRKLIT